MRRTVLAMLAWGAIGVSASAQEKVNFNGGGVENGLAGQFAFGEFTIDATHPDPEVTFRLVRDDGKILHELTLQRSQLTPGAAADPAAGEKEGGPR